MADRRLWVMIGYETNEFCGNDCARDAAGMAWVNETDAMETGAIAGADRETGTIGVILCGVAAANSCAIRDGCKVDCAAADRSLFIGICWDICAMECGTVAEVGAIGLGFKDWVTGGMLFCLPRRSWAF